MLNSDAEGQGTMPDSVGSPAPRKGLATWAKVLLGCFGAAVVLGLLAIFGLSALYNSFTDARGRAMETVAVKSLRDYARAQESYRQGAGVSGPRTGYARRVVELVELKGPGGQQLFGELHGVAYSGSGPAGQYGGYRFAEVASIGGRPVDWSGEFALSAAPAGDVEGSRGKRTFVVTTGGQVWARELSPDGAPVTDFPADPAAAGWRIAE